jgi:hypothetical protein
VCTALLCTADHLVKQLAVRHLKGSSSGSSRRFNGR